MHRSYWDSLSEEQKKFLEFMNRALEEYQPKPAFLAQPFGRGYIYNGDNDIGSGWSAYEAYNPVTNDWLVRLTYEPNELPTTPDWGLVIVSLIFSEDDNADRLEIPRSEHEI